MALLLPGPADLRRTTAQPGLGREKRRTRTVRSLGRVEIIGDPNKARDLWAEMEAICPNSIYQTRRWALAWLDTVGAACDAFPMLVAAYARTGEPVAFLPLGVVAHERIRIAGFLGGRDSNANFGLFRPGVRWTRGDIESIFRAAALKAARRPDVFALSHQPHEWEGAPNPLLELPHQPSASAGHSTLLARDGKSDGKSFACAKLSPTTRKKLDRKWRRLESLAGPLTYRKAERPDDAAHFLDAFFRQKLARFKQQGIESDLDHPAARAFLERAALGGGRRRPAIELHALAAGDRIFAVYGGALHRSRFHAMFNSFELAEEVAKSSPGDLLLRAMIETMCADGVECFDLGVGEARYKDAWCENIEPLFETIIPVTAKGRAFAMAESTRLRLKRQVKQSPWLWSLAQRLRMRVAP